MTELALFAFVFYDISAWMAGLNFVNIVRTTHNLWTEYSVCITDTEIQKSRDDTEIKLTRKCEETEILGLFDFIQIDIKLVLYLA